MNDTSVNAAVIFARNCIRAANHAAARGQYRLAAELRAPAQPAVAAANASVAQLREVPQRRNVRGRLPRRSWPGLGGCTDAVGG